MTTTRGASKRALVLLAAAALAAPVGGAAGASDAEELPDHLVWPPHMKVQSVPAPGVFTGIEGPARFETNAYGIRGPEFGPSRRKEYRILFLGGSATECFYLDQDEAWPALAGARLGKTGDGRSVWAGDAGRSGHNARDHVVEMRLLVPRLPVDAVVVMMGVNDLGLRLAQDRAHDPGYLGAEERVADQVKHAFSVRPDDPNLPFYRKGAVGRLLGLHPDVVKRKPHQVVDMAGRAFETWRDHRRTGRIVEELPDLDGALAEHARHVEEIARRGREAGMRVIFVTQPALWRAGLSERELGTLWMGGIGDYQAAPGGLYYSAEALGRGLAAYNARLLEACRGAGAECLDLAPLVKQDLGVFYDDCHFNEAGSRTVAEIVAGWLAERPPFARGGR